MDLVERVRRSTRDVVTRARWVTIDPVALAAFARRLCDDGSLLDGFGGLGPGTRSPSRDPWWVGDVENPELRAAWVLTLATVNFGSGWHDVLHKRPGLSGATTVAAAWRSGAESAGLLDPHTLSVVEAPTIRALLGQPDDGASGPITTLMEHFASALREIGTATTQRFDGRFLAMADAGAGSAVALATVLGALPSFDDRANHQGVEVCFFKRAQLAAADVHRAFPQGYFSEGSPGPLLDFGRLTAFADNLVPHVFRIEGVLHFDPTLRSRIDRGELLEPGGAHEVEIRAAGVHAVELLIAELRLMGAMLNAADLDAALWRRGGSPRCKAEPRHRCRTIYY